MKAFLSLVVAVAVCNFANAASVAEDVTQCHSRYGTFNVGKSALTKLCGELTCKADGTSDVNICPYLSVAAGSIIIPEDLSKPFPNCCEKAIRAEDAKPCVDSHYGTFNAGKTALTKQCGVAICREDQRLEIDICPALSIGPGYILVPEDLSKPHPECCEKAVKAPSA